MEINLLTLHISRDRNDSEYLRWRVTRSHWATGGKGLTGTIAEGSVHSPGRVTALQVLADNLPMIQRQLLEILDGRSDKTS